MTHSAPGEAEIYGLRTCDTCRKARKALESHGFAARLVDVRETPLAREVIEEFFARFGTVLLNIRSTTWRGLDDAARACSPVDLILAHPTLMKRPVIRSAVLTLGWSEAILAEHLGSSPPGA